VGSVLFGFPLAYSKRSDSLLVGWILQLCGNGDSS